MTIVTNQWQVVHETRSNDTFHVLKDFLTVGWTINYMHHSYNLKYSSITTSCGGRGRGKREMMWKKISRDKQMKGGCACNQGKNVIIQIEQRDRMWNAPLLRNTKSH